MSAPPLLPTIRTLAIRNRLADLILAALDDTEVERTVRLLADLANDSPACPPHAAASALLAKAEGLVILADDRPRWTEESTAELAALRARLAAAVSTLDRRTTALSVPGIERLLHDAAILFNHGLFFEVHELLEPPWKEASEPLRTFLQGLIQVAAGFHHLAGGNRRGAASLLASGRARLVPFAPEAFGVELAVFLRAIETIIEALRDDDPGPPGPPPLRYGRVGRSHDGD